MIDYRMSNLVERTCWPSYNHSLLSQTWFPYPAMMCSICLQTAESRLPVSNLWLLINLTPCKQEPLWLFFQSPGIAALLIDMSNNRARYRIVASLHCIRMFLGIPSGPVDTFLPIASNCFLIMLMLMVNVSPEWADCICGLFYLQAKDTK